MTSPRHLMWSAGTVLFLVAFLMGVPQPALAASFVLETVVGANTGCDPAGPYGGPGQCLNDEDPVNFQIFGPDASYPPGVGAGLVSISGPWVLNNGDVMTGAATADAEFGRLMVRASAAYDLSSSETAGTFANAHVIDQLTIEALGLAGTTGTLDVTYLLDGTISSSGEIRAGVGVGVMWGGTAPFNQDDSVFSFYETSITAPVTVVVPFTYGTPFFLASILGAGAGTFDDCVGACPEGPITFAPRIGAGSGSADFFNTLELTGLIPKDAFGVVVSDPTFSSASGTRYSVEGVVEGAVPEPGSLLLLGTGLALGARRWRRRMEMR